jgi:hypothetical protein
MCSKSHPGRTVWSFLLAVAAVCLASGAALATCNPTLPISAGAVPCYIVVQPIDVCLSNGQGCAPFNTTPGTPNPGTAGMPTNETSPNPIGFTVNPTTGVSPPPSGGVDITRQLLNSVGVDLTWNPMVKFTSPSTKNFTTLNVTQGATCSGTLAKGSTTLTIKSCSSGILAVSDTLSGTGITTGTTIAASGLVGAAGTYTGKGGAGTYKLSMAATTNVGTAETITSTSTLLQSQDFLTLSQQDPKVTSPCPISQMSIPATSPCVPVSPLSSDPSTINMFFVSKLNPPASGGTLYGFSWIGNNGVAIGGNTFFAPTPLQARPDTIAHELVHDLGLDHATYGAGPYNPQSSSNPFGGIAQQVTPTPLLQECDPSYPACGANLMTTGSLRTEPTVACVLAPLAGGAATTPAACLNTVGGQTVQLPGLNTGLADQVTPLPLAFFSPAPTQAQLPTSQQAAVLGGMSGLLQTPQAAQNGPLPSFASGFVNPIPYDTTKAQLGTGGSSTDPIIFDLSGPAGGRPGETLVAWVLTLAPGQTFARHDRFHVVSQSREDLVEDVNYYPDSDKNPIVKDIAYHPGADNNSDNPHIGTAADSPCASTSAECLMVKFQTPGLGANDSISFSEGILKSILFSKGMLSRGGAPITNNDLCKAKITYIFSDGYATTSNFGPCPPVSLPLISSSWRPDPTVSPRKVRTDVLLAQLRARGGVAPVEAQNAHITNVASTAPAPRPGIPAGPVDPFPVPAGWTCAGNCGTDGANGVVTLSPIGNAEYEWVSTTGGVVGVGALPTGALGSETDGSTLSTPVFSATPGTALNFYFNYVTSDGSGFADYAWAELFDSSNNPVALLFTARTEPNGSIIPGAGLPAPLATLTPASVPIMPGSGTQCGSSCNSPAGGPVWPELGPWSGDCWATGCGYTGWVQANYVIPTAGHYYLKVGVVNWNDQLYDSGLAMDGVTIGGVPLTTVLPCTPDPHNPMQCLFQVGQTGLEDADPKTEGGQLGRSCNNSAASGTDVSGTINGNVTVSAGQQCNFKSPCEIKGNLTINGDPSGVLPTGVWLGCALDGNLTDNSGTLVLAPSASVAGNVQIFGASAFTLRPGALIDGNLTIHNVPGTQLGTVCGTTVKGNLVVQSNRSPIEIGGATPQNCSGNTVSGNLQCSGNNPVPTSGSNTVSGHNQCSG